MKADGCESPISLDLLARRKRLIRYVKFDNRLVARRFYLVITAPKRFGLKLLAIFRELVRFLACTAYVATYTVGIVHMIEIIMMMIIIIMKI